MGGLMSPHHTQRYSRIPMRDAARNEYLIRKDPAMSVQTVARKFVELCTQGKNFDVMRSCPPNGVLKPAARLLVRSRSASLLRYLK